MKRILMALMLLSSYTMAFSQWTFNHFVDEFGDETGKPYILYFDVNGRFSNSATSGSTLFTKCIISFPEDDSLPDIRFDLFEYGSGPAVGKAIGDAKYSLTLKFADNTKEEYNLDPGENSLYLDFFDVSQKTTFLQHLKKESKQIKGYILIDGDYSTQSYLFTLSPIGFSSAYSKIKPIKSKVF